MMPCGLVLDIFSRHAGAAGLPGHPNFQEQRLSEIVPFNIVILFRGQNYNERGAAPLRFIATGEPGR